MPELKIIIDNREVEVENQSESPVLISYELESEKDFQEKTSATAFDATFPATLANEQTFNSFSNPTVADMSPGGRFRSARPARIIADNIPVLVGKALLKGGRHTERPESYTVNFYGDNGDWILEMKDLTLYDCLPTTTHLFALYGAGGVGGPSAAPYGIEDSWFFDGTVETKSWVYAPVRYSTAFADNDSNVRITQMRPSLFLYWIIYRAFKKFGYRISSNFMDSPVFRRLVMPWTWGNFMGINSKLADLLKFRATGPTGGGIFELSTVGSGSGSGDIKPGIGNGGGGFQNFGLSNTISLGGYDNNANYTYNAGTGVSTWTYKTANGYNFGKITAYFGVKTSGGVGAGVNSSAGIQIEVYKNGVLIINHTQYSIASGTTGGNDDGDRTFNFSVSGLLVGDTVAIKFRYNYFRTSLGSVRMTLGASPALSPFQNAQTNFELFRIEIEPGGTVDWSNFDQFKKYKFLDLLRGTIDLFDLIPKTDPVAKVVVIEPAHPATVGATTFAGYHKPNRINWSDKQDMSRLSETESFDDAQRDYIFKLADDTDDGGLQILGKRYSTLPGSGKFRFGPRFKEGVQTFENRFFSPVTHLRMTQWAALAGGGGITPQIVAIVPENISNTSAAESEATFAPKICFYKGYVAGAGVFTMNGYTYSAYPFMYAVNYQPGGENELALTYNDQRINGVVTPGLLRRFFLQRLAIQELGVRYKPWFQLTNTDVTNWFHRERILLGGTTYLLTNIDRWNPIHAVSTQCTLWKFTPVEQKHRDQIFPSAGAVLGTLSPVPDPDLVYHQMFILPSDLPTI